MKILASIKRCDRETLEKLYSKKEHHDNNKLSHHFNSVQLNDYDLFAQRRKLLLFGAINNDNSLGDIWYCCSRKR